jgi:hypothetical protein
MAGSDKYADVPARIRINTAHTVCSMIDQTGKVYDWSRQITEDVIPAAFGDTSESASYWASWFMHDSVYYYGSEYSDQFGEI